MITAAGKYADVRAAATTTTTGNSVAGKPAGGTVTRSTGFVPHTFNVGRGLSKAPAPVALKEFIAAEMREGRLVHEYFRRERATMAERLRAHARAFHGVKPNPKSDFQLLANVPGRLYHRWKQKDRHFWQDRNNLKSLKRSEPEACIYV